MRSWLRETGRLFLTYMAMGVSFIPFALIYALWRVNGGTQWYVLVLPFFGGALAGFATKRFIDRRWFPIIEHRRVIVTDVFPETALMERLTANSLAEANSEIWVIHGGENNLAITAPHSSTANTDIRMFGSSIDAAAAA